MRIHLKNLDRWRALPIDEFVPQMKMILRTDPRIICTQEFGVLIRERKDEIIEYHLPKS